MNREEILERSRSEKKDEGMLNGVDTKAPMAMFWAFTAAEAYPKYRFTKKKAYLVTTVAAAMASTADLLNYVMQVLRV